MIHRTTARLSLLFVAACAGAPSPIERELAKTPEGQVTIVEFVDYRCTHCQTMFDVLAPLLDRNEGRVRVVVKHVPLEKHPGAREAAAIAICAEDQGKLEPVHEALMRGASTRDEEALTLAQSAGLDLERFKECLRGDLPRQRLGDDGTAWEEAGGDGLPMIFVGKQKFVGVTDIAAIEAAFDAAK
jgi:protein-disulfide isomerase